MGRYDVIIMKLFSLFYWSMIAFYGLFMGNYSIYEGINTFRKGFTIQNNRVYSVMQFVFFVILGCGVIPYFFAPTFTIAVAIVMAIVVIAALIIFIKIQLKTFGVTVYGGISDDLTKIFEPLLKRQGVDISKADDDGRPIEINYKQHAFGVVISLNPGKRVPNKKMLLRDLNKVLISLNRFRRKKAAAFSYAIGAVMLALSITLLFLVSTNLYKNF
jgi:hypothetical protein